jgi:hypothetical protein
VDRLRIDTIILSHFHGGRFIVWHLLYCWLIIIGPIVGWLFSYSLQGRCGIDTYRWHLSSWT